MGALGWTTDRAAGLVTIRGVGVLDLSFATSFRVAMRAEGAAGYCKLFDLSRADIRLSDKDLEAMAASTRIGGPIKSGPIAIYLGMTPPPLLLDMAVLMKRRIGHRRRLRLFTDELLAQQWLAEEGPVVNPSDRYGLLASNVTRNGWPGQATTITGESAKKATID